MAAYVRKLLLRRGVEWSNCCYIPCGIRSTVMKISATDRVKLAPGFWSSLRLLGISPQEVARHARLSLTVINDPVVTTAQYYAIWQAYAELVGDTATAIVNLATSFETAQYPPAALATFHARDFRDALMRMSRYKQMCPPERLFLRQEGEHVVVDLGWQHAVEPGPPVLVGITLAYLLELGRRGTGRPLKAHFVELVHDIGNSKVLEDFFGCSVRVGASGNRLTLYVSDLERPFISYNEELLDILTPTLDRHLDEHQSRGKISNKVKWILSRCLSRGSIDIQTVAKELGMSDRTLQRRLTEEGASFKQLLVQTRHEQALSYLADLSLEIKEIAFLVGYEDQNSFYRAFRSWEGETPANWRLAQEHWRSSLVTE